MENTKKKAIKKKYEHRIAGNVVTLASKCTYYNENGTKSVVELYDTITGDITGLIHYTHSNNGSMEICLYDACGDVCNKSIYRVNKHGHVVYNERYTGVTITYKHKYDDHGNLLSLFDDLYEYEYTDDGKISRKVLRDAVSGEIGKEQSILYTADGLISQITTHLYVHGGPYVDVMGYNDDRDIDNIPFSVGETIHTNFTPPIDPNGYTMVESFTYDKEGKLLKIESSDGGLCVYEYNVNGDLFRKTTTYCGNHVSRYEYTYEYYD